MRILAIVALIAAAVFAAGQEGWARLALRAHMPSLASAFSNDDEIRGLASYRMGDFADAAEALRRAGSRATFNRGNALARAGKYEQAVGAYDAVIARDPSHQGARANRAIVIKLIASATEQGAGSRAQGTEEGERNKARNKNESMTMLEAEAAVRERASQVRRPYESKALIANEQWLTTLADEPGRYLKLRIAAEYQRRLEAGTAAPPGDDPW
jgi:Ca-activated chloride channel family protein